MNNVIRIKVVFYGPIAPDTGYAWSGVDQHSIEIEQNSFASHYSHLINISATVPSVVLTMFF
jgi:hypothetical protein